MKRRPKILYIQKPPGGGSVVALYDMVKVLDKEKFEPVILCYELNRYTQVFNELGVKTIFLNVKKKSGNGTAAKQKNPYRIFAPFRKLKRLIIDDRRKSRQIASIIKENKIDLIHHNNDINESRQAILANRKTRLPQICHYRSLKPYQKDPFNYSVDYFMAKNVNHHIFISHAVAKHFTKNLKIKKHKGVVIRDIIDVKKFKPQVRNVAIQLELGLQDADIIISNIGRISRWKGQHIFIKALAELVKEYPEVKALVVGPSEPGVGDPIYFNELQKLTEDLQLNHHVIFTGNREDIPAILSVTDIVVHSSIEPEPQGLVIVEALFYGKPVIVSDAGGSAELIVNNQGGLKVPPGNPSELAKAMVQLIKCHLKEAVYLNATNRPLILSEFNPGRQIKSIEDIYTSLLNL
ncbi:MAG: glycosyltransferase family 4 protein [Chitinophagaceae bacterium]|nr:glycosyltransferase family 4 protein [Chitinophagaceae bacterium]